MGFSERGKQDVDIGDIAQDFFNASKKAALDRSMEQRFPELNEEAIQSLHRLQGAYDQITVLLADEKFRYKYAFGDIMMSIEPSWGGTAAQTSESVKNALRHLDRYLSEMSENMIFRGEQGEAVKVSLERYREALISLQDVFEK